MFNKRMTTVVDPETFKGEGEDNVLATTSFSELVSSIDNRFLYSSDLSSLIRYRTAAAYVAA